MTARLALFLPSLDGGGAERVFVDLANEFAARGLLVDLVLAKYEGPYRGEVARGVRVVDLSARRLLYALPGLVRYLRRERPAAMLSGLDHANVVAVLARRLAHVPTRCVISMRSVPSEVYRRAESPGSQILFRFLRATYLRADSIVANSRAVAADLARVLDLPLERLRVIYNPINLERVEAQSREPLAHAWLAAGTMPLILGVGSLSPLKDFGTLIRALAIVRRSHACRLAILGEGPERKRLESLARAAGVAGEVLMPGFVENPFSWMRHARVFISSSVTEGFPNAVMQALAIGVPVVSTDAIGGSSELLEGGKWGRLVPVGQPEAMAEAILAALATGASPQSRRRAADFSHERIANQFLEVLLPWENPA